jgi:hypothetical protein
LNFAGSDEVVYAVAGDAPDRTERDDLRLMTAGRAVEAINY